MKFTEKQIEEEIQWIRSWDPTQEVEIRQMAIEILQRGKK
jgi:hypothetical protein